MIYSPKYKLAFFISIIAMSVTTVDADVTGFEVAYGTVDGDGTLLSGQGVKTERKSDGIIKYKFSPDFQHSAVIMFSPLDVTNRAVRIVKNESENRKKEVRSDSYNLHSSSGQSPTQTDTKLSFIALAKVDDGHTSNLLQSTQAQFVAYNWQNDSVIDSSNIDLANSSRLSTGVYKITFARAFNGTPGAVANYNHLVDKNNQGTPSNPTEPVRTVTLSNLNSTQVIVKITDENGHLIDSNFTLIAIGKAANGVTNGLLSQAKIAYGRYEKGNNDNKTFGYHMGKSDKDNPASYEVPFTDEFRSAPFTIANVEHESESHLRQVQINSSTSQAKFQVAGRTTCCSLAAGNDARYDILAIYPE